MWSFSSFWPPDLIVSPSSFLCCCHPQFVAHQLKERGNISPPPPTTATTTTNHHHQPSLLFCAAAGFCWTITQRDLYWYWFALWWDVFQPLRAERGEYKRTVRRMNCCRLVFGASGDALIGVCGPCASPLDRDISSKHFPQPSLSLWSLFCCCCCLFFPFSSQCGRLAGLKAHRLTMGDSMWRYYFGVLFIALKVDLCRALILESIYWNTTNTK